MAILEKNISLSYVRKTMEQWDKVSYVLTLG